jgi:hypothetical protein
LLLPERIHSYTQKKRALAAVEKIGAEEKKREKKRRDNRKKKEQQKLVISASFRTMSIL